MTTQTTSGASRRTRRRSGSNRAAAPKTTKTTSSSQAPTSTPTKPEATTRPKNTTTTPKTGPKKGASTSADAKSTTRERRTPPARKPETAAAPLTGTLRIHPRGFGFVDAAASGATPSSAGDTPLSCFVPPPLTNGLLADDQVEADYVLEDDGRATATEVRLISRTRTTLFGVVENDADGNATLLRPDPHVATTKWRLEPGKVAARAGSAVHAEVTGRRSVTAVDTYSDPVSADALRARVLDRHQIEVTYPTAVLDQVAASLAVTAAAETADGRNAGLSTSDTRVPRRDLRDLTTFTIDSDSSRDLDDALSVYPAGVDGGMRVLVHIADVAAHVPAGSPLDLEARRTATSLYLPGWTRPMLPPELSEDALSLLPGVDRDALTVEMRVMPDGQVASADVYASTIRSDTRLSYYTAADILAGERPDSVPDEVIDALRWLRTAGARLGIQRTRRGGVDARRVEPELDVRVVDNVATQVDASPSNPANLLIERLMVATNEAVESWMTARGLLTLRRAHPAPDPEAARTLEAFCAGAGYHPGFGVELTPLGLAALSVQLEDAADETASAVWDVLLSHLGRAFYTPLELGHFGLASRGYLHFTSPIRRYADLCVHRIIRAYLAGDRDPSHFLTFDELTELGDHINAATGVAARAEAHTRKAMWLATLAADPAKGALNGRVSGVNAKGAFVTLEKSHLSGFLPSRELAGRGWELNEDGLSLVDLSGRQVGFGDRVKVEVALADVEAGQLDLRDPKARGRAGARDNAPKSSSRPSNKTTRKAPAKKAAAGPAKKSPARAPRSRAAKATTAAASN